jgi:peptide/nickel transport system ATP-binding protein
VTDVTLHILDEPRNHLDNPVVLEIENLDVDYELSTESLPAVRNVSLQLRRGQVVGIAGESGSGKSTLAYAVTRLLRSPGVITAGTITYHPRDSVPVNVLGMNDDELRAFRWDELAIVFQSAMNALNPVLTLQSQILDVLAAHRPQMTRLDRMARMGELLRLVGISSDRAGAYPHELSGGMRQRAMISIALALEPEVIILDEPTTALDVVMQRQILAKLMELRDRLGFSIIFITHDLSLLLEVADEIAVMYAGRIIERGTSSEIYRTPRHPYSYGLLNSFPLLHGPRQMLTGIVGFPPDLRQLPPGCPFNPRCSFVHEGCDRDRPALKPSPVAGDAANHFVACSLYEGGAVPVQLGSARVHDEATSIVASAPALGPVGEPVMRVCDLQKFFPVHQHVARRLRRTKSRMVRAVDGVSLELYAGKVTALVGESGSGKSTIGRVLAQLYRSSGGTISLEGRDVRVHHGRSFRAYVRKVQIVLQDPFSSLNPLHTVGYHLARPLKIHGLARSKSEIDEGIATLLADVHLSPPDQFVTKYPHELSGGQRQRIALARALATRPSVILADEPVSMLDVSTRLGVLNLMRGLATDRQLALLYITHDIASARYFADTTLVMYAGQLIEGGPSEIVALEPAHPYTQLLRDSAPNPEKESISTRVAIGDPPSLIDPPSGCRFHPRCPQAKDICQAEAPPRSELSRGQWTTCWLYDPRYEASAEITRVLR